MIRFLVLAILVAGCSNPQAGLGIGFGPGGVSVSPVLYGDIGGVGVSAGGVIN